MNRTDRADRTRRILKLFDSGMRPVEITRSLRLAHSIVATQLRNIGPTGRASPTPGVIPPSTHWPLRAFGKRKLLGCSRHWA